MGSGAHLPQATSVGMGSGALPRATSVGMGIDYDPSPSFTVVSLWSDCDSSGSSDSSSCDFGGGDSGGGGATGEW